MSTKKIISRKIEIPNGTEIQNNKGLITIKSNKGTLTRRFSNPALEIKIEQDSLTISSRQNPSKNTKRIINTVVSHIKNMIEGLQNPYTYKLKIVSGHFPMNVTIDKNIIVIKNFLGEKVPRKAKVLDGSKAEIKGDEITVTSINKELAGQTAANIEMATRITNKDRRIFSDGIFITQKALRG